MNRTQTPTNKVYLVSLFVILKKLSALFFLITLGYLFYNGRFQSGSHNDITLYVLAACASAFLLLVLLVAFFNSMIFCPLCRSHPFVTNKSIIKKDCPRLFGSATLSLSTKVLAHGRFDCPYCEFENSLFTKFSNITPIDEHQEPSSFARSSKPKSLPPRKRKSA